MQAINLCSGPLFSNQFLFQILYTFPSEAWHKPIIAESNKHTDIVDQAVSFSINRLYNYIEENTVQSDG